MPNTPGFLWPEPNVQLNGTTLVVKQAKWKQQGSFLSLNEPAKWMAVVYVNNVIRYGAVPSSGTTIWTDEMPMTQKSVAVDLSAYGVDAAGPLYPTIKVQQYGGSYNGSGWNWGSLNWENAAVPLITYIDSIGGEPRPTTRVWEPEAVTDPWNPLSRGFYDEGCITPGDFAWSPFTNSGAPSSSSGMQFQVILPVCRIEGVQIWIPQEIFDALVEPMIVTVRLWKGQASAPPTAVVRSDDITIQFAGWTNFFWTEGFEPADTQLIPDTASPTSPYPYKPNPAYDGWYVIGYQLDGGKMRSGPTPTAYSPLFPEHTKVYMRDNYPAGSQLVNNLRPVTERGGDWAPNFNFGQYLFVGPIMSYIPIYPLPIFNQQIYRRVGAAQ